MRCPVLEGSTTPDWRNTPVVVKPESLPLGINEHSRSSGVGNPGAGGLKYRETCAHLARRWCDRIQLGVKLRLPRNWLSSSASVYRHGPCEHIGRKNSVPTEAI